MLALGLREGRRRARSISRSCARARSSRRGRSGRRQHTSNATSSAPARGSCTTSTTSRVARRPRARFPCSRRRFRRSRTTPAPSPSRWTIPGQGHSGRPRPARPSTWYVARQDRWTAIPGWPRSSPAPASPSSHTPFRTSAGRSDVDRHQGARECHTPSPAPARSGVGCRVSRPNERPERPLGTESPQSRGAEVPRRSAVLWCRSPPSRARVPDTQRCRQVLA
mmetsp:Transcript_47768/g.113704  ORF Transcript_47768/g.113704 Transcript_47768/m.113704 type:complete len:223 (+) Transcript_47768:1163-1831(+)